MNPEQENDLYLRAIDRWGKRNQMDMMIQEAAELIQAITNDRRGRDENDNLIEEMVDCQIMINQLKIIVNDDSKWNRWMAFKLDRLQSYIEQDEEQGGKP